MMKRKSWIAILLVLVLVTPGMALALEQNPGQTRLAPAAQPPVEATPSVEINAPSATLIEASTGRVILEKNAHERRPVASVTKLMTILLTLEALDAGTVRLSDNVLCSQKASGMGGSQALLDAGASYKLEDLLKTVIVASANDAAVALAEHMSGAQEVFVAQMNARAQELGLENTHYVNCTGLPAEGHYTTAYDVAQLSRQLDKHPTYYKFSRIWMDTITHKGGRVTDLTNTNRLVRFTDDVDGYKTGSTNEARYCISATAKRGNMRLIAVVLGASSGQIRFDEARKLLDYGFANYQLIPVAQAGELLGTPVAVRRGAQEVVDAAMGEGLSLLLRRGEEKGLSVEAVLPEAVTAPIKQGEILGEVRVLMNGEEIARLPAVAAGDVMLPGFLEGLLRILEGWRMR